MLQFGATRGTVELLRVKPPAVAGMFYPGEPAALRDAVNGYLGAVDVDEPPPKAIIAPHAGYRYSGPVAACAYARLARAADRIRRVVLLGPAHRVAFSGLAVSGAGVFTTPLGEIPVDRATVERLARLPGVGRLDEAFAHEHSLEVHLPFLQVCLERFTLVPLVVGQATPEQVNAVLEAAWGGEETAIVVSSDLSHYHDYATAQRMDAATSKAIESLSTGIGDHDACGRNAVNGLLHLARRRGLTARTVDLRNSGDTAGPRDRVVGYGAYVVEEPDETATGTGTGQPALTREQRRRLLGVAASAIRHGLADGKPRPVEASAHPEPLREPRASFITLELDGKLRGCMGSLAASAPLVEDVARNAFNAAFRDPRFAPVKAEEADRLEISVSVLGRPRALPCGSREELVSRLRPGVDGLIISDGTKRATFLPAVWKSLPEPEAFVAQLMHKAGLPRDHWSDTVRVERYTSESFS